MKKTTPIISAGVLIVIIGIVILLQTSSPQPVIEKTESLYITANSLLKEKLAENQIKMSSPIKLSDPNDIRKYCSFFTSDEKQQLIQYCTSTELKDANDAFLGNIHMVGSADEPKITMALIQTDYPSDLDSVKIIFGIVTDNLVCDCWAQQKPGGLDNMGQWVDGLYQFHQSDAKPHSKSNPIQLGDKSLQLELTTNEGGYLWQFFIYS
jgi:hypothetical protein